MAPQETGWVVKDLPPGFSKVVEGYRTLRGKSDKVAHLVFSDGLVAVSVFVEPTPATPQPVGLSQQGGVNVYSRPLNEHLVTVLGEAPGAHRAPDRLFGQPPLADRFRFTRTQRQRYRSMKYRVWTMLVALSSFTWFAHAAAAQQGRLPDFTELYEQQGAAVVSIDVTQKAKRQQSPFPDLSEDDPFYEFFRRFGQIRIRADRASVNSSSRRPAPASSSRPTATC